MLHPSSNLFLESIESDKEGEELQLTLRKKSVKGGKSYNNNDNKDLFENFDDEGDNMIDVRAGDDGEMIF